MLQGWGVCAGMGSCASGRTALRKVLQLGITQLLHHLQGWKETQVLEVWEQLRSRGIREYPKVNSAQSYWGWGHLLSTGSCHFHKGEGVCHLFSEEPSHGDLEPIVR